MTFMKHVMRTREFFAWPQRNCSHTYFLHRAVNDCADTNPVFSPPAALNMGAFQ